MQYITSVIKHLRYITALTKSFLTINLGAFCVSSYSCSQYKIVVNYKTFDN